MVSFGGISMLLVLLEPVNRADSKYAFAVWIGSQICELLVLLEPVNRVDFKYACTVWIRSQIQEIFTADSQSRVKCLPGRFCRGFYLILFESKILWLFSIPSQF